MKKTILFLASASALIASHAQQPNDVTVRQRNSTNTGWLDKFLSPPASGADGLMYIDNTVTPPNATVVALGSGLTIASGIISAAGGGAAQVNSDWNATSGVASILNKPVLFNGAYSSLTGAPDLSGYVTTSAVTSALAGKANVVHTHVATDITDSTATGRAVLTAPTAASARSTLGVQSTSEAVAAYYPLASNPSAYVNQAGARTAISLTTTGSGAATYNSATGALNVPAAAAASPFNFSQPSARALVVSTSYQATDNTKAAVIVPSYACQNSTTVLAASACTVQVRMGTGTLTCSTGTVYYTQSLTVALGVLITQNSTNPVQINLPIGASFVICPVAGTFTVSAVEQTAG